MNLLICWSSQITSSAASDLNIKGDGKAIIRGNEGVNIMGRTVEFKMGGGIELRAVSERTQDLCLLCCLCKLCQKNFTLCLCPLCPPPALPCCRRTASSSTAR